MKLLVVTTLIIMSSIQTGLASEGARLAYVLGCVNCHHQTPREIIDAPPLLIVRGYTLDDFEKLLRTGLTSSGRNLLEIGSIMGIVAVEQFSYLSDAEIQAIYEYLSDGWTHQQALKEEAKIPQLYKMKIPASEYE